MKTNKIHFLLHTFFFCLLLNAQVGINETDPQAMLDIKASNQATPTATDGILIPRINAFPATNPVAAQNAMLVYLTTTSGTNTPGFYYWNNTDTKWVKIISGGDDNDWHKESTSLSPASINDNIFTHGDVGIGTNNPTSRLHVIDTVSGPVVNIVNKITSSDQPAIQGETKSTPGYGIGADFTGGYVGLDATADATTYSGTAFGLRSEATGSAGTRIGGEFRASGGSNNYALRLIDGSQADGKILTSDASGNATWKDPAIDNVVFNKGTTPYGVDVPYNTSAYLQTGSYITLPPGKFAVNVTMLITESIVGGVFVLSPPDSQFWIRSSFSDSNVGGTISGDIEGSALISGSLQGSSHFGLVTGTVIINNTSGANKTYYYIAGGTTVHNTTNTVNGFGGAWGEDNIIAYRLN